MSKSPTIEELKTEIEEAFTNVEYPGDDNLIDADAIVRPEWDALSQAFKGKHWQELSLEFLLRHHDALSAFTPNAFRYYLPAFLLASATDYVESDIIPEHIVYSLSTPSDVKNHKSFRDKMAVLTAAQRGAIRSYLDFIKTCFAYDDPLLVCEINKVLAADF